MFSSIGPTFRRSIEPALVAVSILSSLAALGGLVWYISGMSEVSIEQRSIYFALFLSLFYCAIVYQINRLGAAIRRSAASDAVELPVAPRYLTGDAPSVTILVPSYREERRVLRMTLLSAVLARYGMRRAVVLLDDPPDSSSLADSRAVVDEVRELVAAPMAYLRHGATQFFAAQTEGVAQLEAERDRLVALYRFAAKWLTTLAGDLDAGIEPAFRHVDRFFVESVVLRLAEDLRGEARAVLAAPLDAAVLACGFEAVSVLFCTEIECFERKRYANLSHAPNKAMNLNAYLALLGGTYVAERRGGQLVLRNAGDDDIADASLRDSLLQVPASKYVLTLDADSVILPSYITTLTDIAEREPTAGVVQTPYHSFPASSSPVERIAGATTDIQYLVHQGSSHYDAAYWVGANALLRLSALDLIKRESAEGGNVIDVFVQDKTLIEDTGSTVDLLEVGYTVRNHFAPLAYSSTPADFGSLAIQRQRWSNGGLIVLPQLIAQYISSAGRLRRILELFLRTHYLISPLVGNFAILMLMVTSLADARHLVLTPLAMLPYFTLYGLDLKSKGYKIRDLFAVSALNLLLLPVGLAGVLASLGQIISGRKGMFLRTPKVAGRTRVSPIYILCNVGLSSLMAFYTAHGLLTGEWMASLLPACSLLLYGYGLTVFVGWGHMADDIWFWVTGLGAGAGAATSEAAKSTVRLLGRAIAHPVARAAGIVTALVIGIAPTTFGTAGGGQRTSAPLVEIASPALQPDANLTDVGEVQ